MKTNCTTCPNGHRLAIVWIVDLRKFGISCVECDWVMEQAHTPYGTIEIVIIKTN